MARAMIPNPKLVPTLMFDGHEVSITGLRLNMAVDQLVAVEIDGLVPTELDVQQLLAQTECVQLTLIVPGMETTHLKTEFQREYSRETRIEFIAKRVVDDVEGTEDVEEGDHR